MLNNTKKMLSFIGHKTLKTKSNNSKVKKTETQIENEEETKINDKSDQDSERFDKQISGMTETLEGFEKPAIQLQRNLDDLKATDINKRTLLHRAALDQNVKLMEDVIKDYEFIRQTDPTVASVKVFIDTPDRFGNTPLLNACSLKIQSESSRLSCIALLLQKGADVNVKNARTLWNAMHWMAYHGELDCAHLLLEHNININQPDYLGYYTIDVAGKQNHQDISLGKLLVEKLFEGMNSYLDDLRTEKTHDDKYWNSPMLKTSILYWAVKFGFNSYTLKIMCDWPNTYIESPMLLIHKMTAIHVAAQDGNDEALNELINKAKSNVSKFKESVDIGNKVRHLVNFSFNPEDNEVFKIPKEDLKKYDEKFIDKIKKFSKWIYNYERDIFDKQAKIWYDEPDLYGNTPLHLASMSGQENCINILIQFGCDLYKTNREGFRPRELIQNSKIKTDLLNLDLIQISPGKKVNKEHELKMGIQNQIEKILEKERYLRMKKNGSFFSARQKRNSAIADCPNVSFSIKSIEDITNGLKDMEKIPEFIIQFHKKPDPLKKTKDRVFDRMNQKDDINANRINFYISLLINANFEVFLAPSIDDDFYYVMLSLDKKQLYKQCHNLKMRLKLIDSYNYEIYEQTKEEDFQTKFEPLRSMQRQEIIYKKVKNILDLHMLKHEGLVKNYFMMHSFSGINHIRKKWIISPKWYWPQPLNQLDDYLLEGKSQNFSSVTSLKQYLGEKISFYFAWRSFCTCYFLPLAFLGAALQLYIILYQDYHSQLLSFWVFFVSLYTTFMVEFWKRKCSEINSRWGGLDLMNDDSWMKEFRNEYSGDECVSSVSQQITKVNTTKVTIYVFLLSLPVLIVLLGLCVGTYLLTKQYKEDYSQSKYATFHSVMSGLINGAVITILNFLYTSIARWFVDKENHKYQSDYENSLISKSFTFRILNSFFTVFVVAFVDSGSDFKDLFDTLWPILIYKQASNIGVQVVLPWLKYKYYQQKYFKKVEKKSSEQRSTNASRASGSRRAKEANPDNDGILEFAKRAGLDYNNYWDRVALFFRLGEQQKEVSFKKCFVDQVELNSHRDEYIDTVDSYAEGFIAFGYVTMFTAAFPIGPAIAVLVDSIELKWKLFSFLFALKRPIAERSTGIGSWLAIWESMSIVSVFTNFLLLFFQEKFQFDIVYKVEQNQDQQLNRLWLVIIMVAIILVLKFVFRALIPDKPKWVMDEEERERAQKDSLKGGEEIKSFSHKYEKELIEEREKLKTKEHRLKLEKESAKKKIKDLENEKDKLKQKLKEKNIQNTSSSLQAWQNTPEDYKAKALSLFFKTFKFVEHELLILRLNDINQYEGISLFLCNECHKSRSVLECLDCQENFCKRCYKEVHIMTHVMLGKMGTPNIALLIQQNTQNEFLLKDKDLNIQDRSKFIKEKLQKENQKKDSPLKKNPKKPSSNNQNIQSNINDWKKFEYFSLPTYEKSSVFSSLIKIFASFYRLYVEGNYIIPGKNALNLDLAVSEFQLEDESMEISTKNSRPSIKANLKNKKNSQIKEGHSEFKDIGGNFLKIKNRNLLDILETEDFNIEDKLFMNRIAFLGFRKYGSQFKFQDFLKYCKKLQDGNQFQKLVLFVRLMEFGEMIEKEDVTEFMFPSLLRNVANEELKCSDVIADLFGKESALKKGSFWAEIDSPKNIEFKNMMEAFMQQNKTTS